MTTVNRGRKASNASKKRSGRANRNKRLGDGLLSSDVARVIYPPPPVTCGPEFAKLRVVANFDKGTLSLDSDFEPRIKIFPGRGRIEAYFSKSEAASAVERCKERLARLQFEKIPRCWDKQAAEEEKLLSAWRRALLTVCPIPTDAVEATFESSPAVRTIIERERETYETWLQGRVRGSFEGRVQVYMSAAASHADQLPMLYVAAFVACLELNDEQYVPGSTARRYLREVESLREDSELQWLEGKNLDPGKADYCYVDRLDEVERKTSRSLVRQLLEANGKIHKASFNAAEAESSVWERTSGLSALAPMASRLLEPTMAFLDQCQTRGQRLALLDAAIDRALTPLCWEWAYLGLAYEWRRHVEQQALPLASRILGSNVPATSRPKFAEHYPDWDQDDVWLHRQLFEGGRPRPAEDSGDASQARRIELGDSADSKRRFEEASERIQQWFGLPELPRIVMAAIMGHKGVRMVTSVLNRDAKWSTNLQRQFDDALCKLDEENGARAAFDKIWLSRGPKFQEAREKLKTIGYGPAPNKSRQTELHALAQ